MMNNQTCQVKEAVVINLLKPEIFEQVKCTHAAGAYSYLKEGVAISKV
jgi:ATP-dependent 26S proteasome regulatory subunit